MKYVWFYACHIRNNVLQYTSKFLFLTPRAYQENRLEVEKYGRVASEWKLLFQIVELVSQQVDLGFCEVDIGSQLVDFTKT